MPRFLSLYRYLLPALMGAALTLGALTTSARAETYGEVGRFGSAGTSHGQFKITSGTHAFGVDTTENSVYVGDETKRGEYRIQKLSATGTYLAQTTPFKPPNHDGIEGIAVDPVEKRIYVLALEKRAEALDIDPSQPAAGTLYAFSTEPSEEILTPATGTAEAVFAGPSTLTPQSDASEVALLGPKGIAVDPVTHDVVILAEVGQEVPEEKEAQTRVALERIHLNGTLGERYVDRAGFFGSDATPNSPVVSPSGAIYVAVQQAQVSELTKAPVDELAQIPAGFSSLAPPLPFAQFTTKGTFEGEEQPIVEFDSNEPAKDGDGLSLAPEGDGGEGTIYARAHIFGRTGGKGAFYPGVLGFNEADGSEFGWTGGQTKLSGSESCVIGFAGETYPSVAAGGKHTVFMLDPKSAHVVEFGPGGKGCPMAEATEPTATVNGQPLSPSEPISASTPITFSSSLTQANALSVEWNFGDGQSAVNADEYQHTEVKHKFVRGGELTVTETIHTDDLATPAIVKTTKVSVSATAPPPTAVLEGPSEMVLGGGTSVGRLVYLEGGGLGVEEATQSEEAAFDASASFVSTATGPNLIESYHWIFGDGESETTSSAIAKHEYKKVGVYKVELTVTDALGLTSEPTTLAVKVNEPAPLTPKGPESVAGIPGTPLAGTPPATTVGGSPTPAGDTPQPTAPDARLASTSLAVSPGGTINLDVICPTSERSCAGTVTLRTLGPVSTDAARGKHKASVLMLATGRFKVTGGRQESIKLRLSAKARLLLIHAHVFRVQATLLAHDSSGATHTEQTTITIHVFQATHRHVVKNLGTISR